MRPIRLTSPPMHGKDVEALQRHINSQLHRWGVSSPALLREDGVFGSVTFLRAKEVAFGLGISAKLVEHGIGPGVQKKIGWARRYLTPAEKKLLGRRGAWRRRLVHRLNGGGATKAVEFALQMARLHIVEHPAGSNLGPYITNWERLAGYNVPPGVYWCGCFVNACLVASGMHSQSTMGIGYVPNIEAHAQAGKDGWSWHHPTQPPKKGWIATFGASIGEHTELVVADGWPLRTVGGNTSAGTGSPNNGGGVYYHNFASYHGMPLRGFAAPRYH